MPEGIYDGKMDLQMFAEAKGWLSVELEWIEEESIEVRTRVHKDAHVDFIIALLEHVINDLKQVEHRQHVRRLVLEEIQKQRNKKEDSGSIETDIPF